MCFLVQKNYDYCIITDEYTDAERDGQAADVYANLNFYARQ